MFDVGFWELSLIAVVALLVVGPARLPGLVRTAGLWAGRMRRYADHIRREIEREVPTQEFKKAMSETPKPLEDIKQTLEETTGSLEETSSELNKLGSDMNKDVDAADSKPTSGGAADTSARTTGSDTAPAPAADTSSGDSKSAEAGGDDTRPTGSNS